MNETVLIDELKQLTVQRIGLTIPDDARERYAGIFRERAKHLDYTSLQDYRNFLASRQADGEWEILARSFSTGETFFFRDHGQFDLMRLQILPELIARHRNDKTLRLWSAGCASGEEAYSLAILVDMLMPEHDGWNILILGTDINSQAIAKARRGQYGNWSFRMIPPEIQQRYFIPKSEIRNPQSATPQSFVLDERIRHMVTFRVSNLRSENFPDSASELHCMDLILCRNVFIYFDPTAALDVAKKFAATLNAGGYLLTAHTELFGHALPDMESRLFAEGMLYQRRSPAPAEPLRSLQVRMPIPSNSLQALEKMRAQADKEPTPTSRPSPASSDGKVSSEAANPLLKKAREYADSGYFEKAEHSCKEALDSNPLAAEPYLLLAQLADVKGDLDHAKDFLNKALYLSPRCIAAHLELATIYERERNMPRAQALRRAALDIISSLPADAVFEQYQTTAADLLQWLEQWEY